MSTIDEIMGAIGRHGDDCIRDADAASASFEGLRDLIAAALADAEREGAEAMREAAGDAAQRAAGKGLSASAVHLCVRALPLPTGERKAVLLTDEHLAAVLCEIQPGDELAAGFSFLSWQSGRPDAASALDEARLVQAAVLAANGLEGAVAEITDQVDCGHYRCYGACGYQQATTTRTTRGVS